MVVTQEQISQFRTHLTTASVAEAAFLAPQLLEVIEALGARVERLTRQLALVRDRLATCEAGLASNPCQACRHVAALTAVGDLKNLAL